MHSCAQLHPSGRKFVYICVIGTVEMSRQTNVIECRRAAVPSVVLYEDTRYPLVPNTAVSSQTGSVDSSNLPEELGRRGRGSATGTLCSAYDRTTRLLLINSRLSACMARLSTGMLHTHRVKSVQSNGSMTAV